MFSTNESIPVVQPQKGAQKAYQAKVAPCRHSNNNPLTHITHPSFYSLQRASYLSRLTPHAGLTGGPRLYFTSENTEAQRR